MDQLLIEVTRPEKVAGVTLTAGFVWWLTRGGGLLASILKGVPSWRQVDLLPIMARGDDENDEHEDEEARVQRAQAEDEEDASQGLFDRGSSAPDAVKGAELG